MFGVGLLLVLAACEAHDTNGSRGRAEEHRHLQGQQQEEIIPEEGWEFPVGTRVAFGSSIESELFGSGSSSQNSLNLLAGYRYSQVSFSVPAEFTLGIDHAQAVIKLVSSASAVTLSECSRSAYDVSMDIVRTSVTLPTYAPSALADGALLRVQTLDVEGTVMGQDTIFPHVAFMHGGYYQLCYSPDGSMVGNEELNAIVPVLLRVFGVASECQGNGCLALERWDCFFSYRYEANSVCRVDFRSFGGGRPGFSVEAAAVSKSLWTSLWGSDSYQLGVFIPGEQRNCSDVSVAEYLVVETDIFESFSWSDSNIGFITDTTTAMDMPPLKPVMATQSYALTVCYCPSYDGPVDGTIVACDDVTEYIQPVGVVYYWLLRVCDAGNTGACGSLVEPFMRILPQQPFSLRLQCPPGGTSCTGSNENRIKFLPAYCPLCQLGSLGDDGEGPFPLWDAGSRCRKGHSESERLIFYPDLFDENGVLIDPGLYRYGGDRRDYKFWELPDLIGKLPMSDRLMVCYCDEGCENFYNFFEVGEIRLADSAGIARWSKVGEGFQIIQPIETVEYPTKAGGITLFAGIRSNLSEGMHPYDSIPWRRKSIMKILSYDNTAEYLPQGSSTKVTLEESLGLHREMTATGRRGLDFACAFNSTSVGTVNGPDGTESAKNFMAWVGPDAAQYLPFTGGENDQTFLFLEAGTYAICYCSFLDNSDECAADTGYIWAASIMVKGTRRNQNVILPTNFVVRIDLEGWGFTTEDTIRLITLTQTCSENAYNPKGVVSGFRLGCPGLDGTSCRSPVVEENIKVYLISAERTGLYIESISIQETKSILFFSGDVTAEVADGDQITLEESTVLLNGRGQLSWTDHERHIVSKLSGIYAFADEPQTTRMLWNRVSYVPGEPRQLSIALGWPEGERPQITFINQRGGWQRRNRLETDEEIKAQQAAQLRICWGASDGPDQEYYGEAGTLTFTTPEPMADAGLYFTSLVGGSTAPVIISFSPTRGKADYKRQTPIVLRILFQEIPRNILPLKATLGPDAEFADNDTITEESMSQAACGRLFVEMWTNDAGGFPLPNGCYYGPLYSDVAEEGQEAPGGYREFFIEFKPIHPLKDQCTGSSGRLESCVYQLVMNMRVEEEEFQLNRQILSLSTLCAGRSGYATICGPRYSIIEYGAVIPSSKIRAPQVNTTELAAVEMLPLAEAMAVGSMGSRGRGAGDDVWQLEASLASAWALGVRAWTRDAAYPIRRSSKLQIIFRPLTLWRLEAPDGSSCNATCVPTEGLSCRDIRGTDRVSCQLRSLVDTNGVSDVPMQQNMIEVEYPDMMDEIPEDRGDESHLLSIRNLHLPREGFFTLAMLAQLIDPETPPSIAFVTPLLKKAPVPGVTTGQILVEGQAGNGPKPFAFELGNEIIVRLTLGATLRNVPISETEANETGDSKLKPAEVQVRLPTGYLCSVVGNGTADPLGEKTFFKQDLNNDGWNDNPMSTIFSGEWSSDGSLCKYQMEATAALFANQFIDVRFSVRNPLQPMLKDDPVNVWTIQLIASDGETLGGPARFLSLEEEKTLPGWIGNLAVLGTLEGESIQPRNLTQGAETSLNVFFQMTRSMPIWSHIVVDAPAHFDFTEFCVVSHLEAEYYQDWEALPWGSEITGPKSTTSTLGDEINCSVDDWQRPADILTATAPYTRAILKIGRTLILGKYYAFQINIKSPEFWNMSQHDGWRLWLQSPDGYMVDGSKYSVQFNAARLDTLPVEPHDRGWAVYPSGLLLPVNFSLGAERILPTSAFDMSAFLSVYPLTPSTDGQLTSLRLIAPVGFVWIPFAEQGWQGYLPNITCKYCELEVTPEVQFQNELLLRNLVMRSTMFYGFRVRMWVPLRPPSRSTNAFYLEIGYDPGKDDYYLDRMQGAMLPAPTIRVVHDVFIYSRCNLAGFNDNIMDFRLRIASPLTVNDGFLIEGNELTRGSLLGCWPSSIPELLSITSVEGNCLVFENAVTLLPVVKIWITESLQMPPGLYGFRFRGVTMPALPTSAMLYWKMGTYSQLHLYPKHEILDVAVDIPSPQVLGFLPEAGILRPNFYAAPSFGRDDAPLKLNILAFYFRISKTPLFAEDMESFVLALRGPLGFFFEEDCSQYLRAFMDPAADGQSRLPCGKDSRVSWCPSAVLMSWPSRLAPVACLGINETARISVPNSAFVEAQQGGHVAVFQPNGVYGFEVQVQNPEMQPSDNRWALDFGNEASKPFVSIQIQSFVPEETKLEMACSVSSQFWWPNLEKYLPFRIDFVPHTTIPAPRMLERRLQSGQDPLLPQAEDFVPHTTIPAPRMLERRLQSGQDPLLPQAEDGSVVVFSPPNFDFPVADFDMCVNSVLEVQNRQPWDFVALFAPGADVVCRVGDVQGVPSTEGGGPERRSMVFLLVHRKAMFQGVAYTLEGSVRNPTLATWPRALTWRMESYTRFIATGERVRLDEYFLEGPAIRAPAKDFQVSNSAAEYYGGVMVYLVDISVVLPAPLMTGQSIEIKAPRGFELGTNSSNGSCLGFRWPGSFRPLRLDALGNCSCNVIEGEVSCRLLMNVSYVPSEPGQAVLPAGDALSFGISVLNPLTPREALRNLWEMTHWDVVQNPRPLSSAFAESWPIYSELANFSIWISGTRKRAGALSDLSLSFIPVAWGSVLEINMHDPPGYDFSETRPASPLAREITSQGSRLVVVNGDFRPGILQTVFLGEVILGSPGGRTRISIQMFSDFRMQSEVARKINFLNGFVQPGSVTIFSQQLLNQAVVSHYEGGTFDSVLPLLPCFAQQLARMEFFFRLSRFISAGSSFILKNLGTDGNNHEFYLESGLEPVIELCHGQDQGRNGSSTQWLCDKVVRVNYTQKQYTRNNFELVNGFRAVLERMGQEYITDTAAVNELAYLTDGRGAMALEAQRAYRVRFWVLPTMMATEWYVATEHETGYLTNTNDGETSAPTAVPQMSLTVTPEVSRNPPVSAVTVSISIRAAEGQRPFSRLLMLPPYGFLPYGAQIPQGTGRPMLELDMTVANPLIDEMTYQLRMHTPRRTNLDPRWFVLARNLQVDEITGEISDHIVGWSFVEGFGVAPCPVTARYGAIPSYTGWLALTFKVPALAKGRFALFSAPENFEPRCPDIKEAGQACEPFQIEEHFPDEILALPIARTLNLTMGTFTAEGQDLVYSAMLIIVTPASLLTLQPWELRILDQSFTVVDAHLEIPSLPFAELQAENPTVKWLTMPQRGEAAMVAIQVIINRRIKSLRMLVFLMPEGFRHDIQHANQLANINKNFPVAIEREWRDFSNLRYVRIFIEPTTVASGTFEWQFPVIVAQKAPINTEWYVFLCEDYFCRVFSDPSVVVVFPVPDFLEKLPAVTFDGLMTGGLQRCHLAKWSLMLLLGGLICRV